jgi:hypothetical protein
MLDCCICLRIACQSQDNNKCANVGLSYTKISANKIFYGWKLGNIDIKKYGKSLDSTAEQGSLVLP